MKPLNIIQKHKLVAIIRLDDLSQAEQLTKALLDGGIRALEFTLTNRDSLKIIPQMFEAFSQFQDGSACIGAGSVNSIFDAQLAIDAGSQFVVSPTTKAPVIEICNARDVPIMTGAFTPTEIENAWEIGADIVKVFPARSLQPSYFKDILAPLPHLKLMPTGGINHENLGEYLNAGVVSIGVGGGLVKKPLIQAGDWESLTNLAKQYVQAVEAIS